MLLSEGDTASDAVWAVFILKNTSDIPVRRILTMAAGLEGKGFFWPEPSPSPVDRILVSGGATPLRLMSGEGDVFSLNLPVASEMTIAMRLPGGVARTVMLGEPEAYARSGERAALLKGILLGVAALLAIYLVGLYMLGRSDLGKWAAILATAVFFNLLALFGYVGSNLGLNAHWSGAVLLLLQGLLLAAGLRYWVRAVEPERHAPQVVTAASMLGYLGIAGGIFAVANHSFAALVLNLAGATGVIGGVIVTLVLALKGGRLARRHLMSVGVIAIAALAFFATLMGVGFPSLVAVPAISTVLLVGLVMISVVVTRQVQTGAVATDIGALRDEQRHAFALVGAQQAIWDWDILRDQLYVSPFLEASLGLPAGAICGEELVWRERLHSADRESYRT
jgi:PAS domain-containing protein